MGPWRMLWSHQPASLGCQHQPALHRPPQLSALAASCHPPASTTEPYCQPSPATRRWYALDGGSLLSVSAPAWKVVVDQPCQTKALKVRAAVHKATAYEGGGATTTNHFWLCPAGRIALAYTSSDPPCTPLAAPKSPSHPWSPLPSCPSSHTPSPFPPYSPSAHHSSPPHPLSPLLLHSCLPLPNQLTLCRAALHSLVVPQPHAPVVLLRADDLGVGVGQRLTPVRTVTDNPEGWKRGRWAGHEQGASRCRGWKPANLPASALTALPFTQTLCFSRPDPECPFSAVL